MSVTLASSGGAVAMASASLCCSNSGTLTVSAKFLMPMVGLVNRTKDGRIFRSQERQRDQLSRGRAGRQQRWIVESMSKAANVGVKDFEAEVLKSPVPVLVDFWATWCGPCKLMAKTLDWAAQEFDGKVKCVKIETDANQPLVDKYSVYGLPTLILFVDGEIVPNTKREGALNKDKLRKYLEDHVPALAATA